MIDKKLDFPPAYEETTRVEARLPEKTVSPSSSGPGQTSQNAPIPTLHVTNPEGCISEDSTLVIGHSFTGSQTITMLNPEVPRPCLSEARNADTAVPEPTTPASPKPAGTKFRLQQPAHAYEASSSGMKVEPEMVEKIEKDLEAGGGGAATAQDPKRRIIRRVRVVCCPCLSGKRKWSMCQKLCCAGIFVGIVGFIVIAIVAVKAIVPGNSMQDDS